MQRALWCSRKITLQVPGEPDVLMYARWQEGTTPAALGAQITGELHRVGHKTAWWLNVGREEALGRLVLGPGPEPTEAPKRG